MDENTIRLFLINNQKYFKSYQLSMMKHILSEAEPNRAMAAMNQDFKDPSVSIILSLCIGYLAIDRFYIGDYLLGFLKLITLGGFGIWFIVDWFVIMGRTRNRNFELFMQYARIY